MTGFCEAVLGDYLEGQQDWLKQSDSLEWLRAEAKRLASRYDEDGRLDSKGKRIHERALRDPLAKDPDTALIITDIFERFATGYWSVKSLVKQMNTEGVQLRGRRLQSSVVHQILRKRLYMGDFDWDGTTYPNMDSNWRT